MATDTPTPAQAAQAVSSHQTSVRHSSAVQSSSTSHGHPQDVMKSQIQSEFKPAKLIDLTAKGAPFHADSDTVQMVLGRLRDHYGTTSHSLLSDNDSPEDTQRFPPGGF
jgi:hypothetical protein